jgi:hypothetical protein
MLGMLESLHSIIHAQVEQAAGALLKLRAMAMGQFEFFLRHRDTLQLFASFSNPSLVRLHKRLLAPFMEKWAAYAQRVTELVEEGQRAGQLRQDIGSRHISLAFIGMTNLAAQNLVGGVLSSGSLDTEEQETPERMADTIMRILVEGVMQR